jgi:N-acetyl-alpha-D-muramate 1-phosphate uridylyltransferase
MVVMPAMMPDPVEPVLTGGLVAVVLAAGEGTRLRPLTRLRPKPLCPVDNVPLVDHALRRARTVTLDVAVNLHHGREALEQHLDGAPVHLSVEDGPEALGTAGALGHLRGWIAGRATVVLNSDTWCPGSLEPLVEGWDGERIRILVEGDDRMHRSIRLAGALMPWSEVAPLAAEPTGLYEVSWGRALAEGRIEVVRWDGPWVDCGTPADYLRANLLASGGAPVVGPGAKVAGRVTRTVVWERSEVHPGEVLVDAVRAGPLTVLVR